LTQILDPPCGFQVAGGDDCSGKAAAAPTMSVGADDDDGQRVRGLQPDLQAGRWEAVGLNEVFGLCRYVKGGLFKPHRDGGYIRCVS
jgi:hypothetical protein